MLQKKDIVVFDFDGTLSKDDTNHAFFRYCMKHSIRPWLFLPYIIVGAIGALFNKYGIWWRQTIRHFITPKMVRDFAPTVIKNHKIKRFDWAKKMVAKEKKDGNIVILISASCDYLIPYLVADMDFDAVMCSQMDKEHPWKYKFFCYNKNKVVALDNWAKEHKIIPNVIRSYSDSPSDLPIMEIAREQIWIDSKTGQRK